MSDKRLFGLQMAARRAAGFVGRDSWLVRRLRPTYENVLDWASRRQGIPWAINGVTFRADPHYRHMLGQVYDPGTADFLRARVRPGDLCFDVGANVGVYVLQFANWAAPNGRVVAFEPNPATQVVLKRHIAMNDLTDRVDVVGCAVGSREGVASFYAAGEDGRSRLGAPSEQIADRVQELKVPVLTLDQYCSDKKLEPDWLLMDIEGFEFQALLGAHDLIRRRGSKLGIVVEMHPDAWASAGTTPERAVEILDEFRLRPIPLVGQQDPLAEYGLVYLAPR